MFSYRRQRFVLNRLKPLTHLVECRVQSEELSVPVGFALLLVVPVDLLIRHSVQQMREQSIRLRVLQVKYTASPTTPRSVIYGHGPALQIILSNTHK